MGEWHAGFRGQIRPTPGPENEFVVTGEQLKDINELIRRTRESAVGDGTKRLLDRLEGVPDKIASMAPAEQAFWRRRHTTECEYYKALRDQLAGWEGAGPRALGETVISLVDEMQASLSRQAAIIGRFDRAHLPIDVPR